MQLDPEAEKHLEAVCEKIVKAVRKAGGEMDYDAIQRAVPTHIVAPYVHVLFERRRLESVVDSTQRVIRGRYRLLDADRRSS